MVEYTNAMMEIDVSAFRRQLEKRFAVERMLLFGSRARGDHFLDSDVDLIIVSRDFAGMRFTERMTRMLEYWEAPVGLEALCYTPEEFEKKKGEVGIVSGALAEGQDVTVG